MNFKMVLKYLAFLLLAEAVFLLPAGLTSLGYAEYVAMGALLGTAGLCALAGLALLLPLRKYSAPIYARESFVVAGLGWLVISLFGGLPFYFSGEIPSFFDALFESVSGFTSTGASILRDVEAMSNSLLFWRSMTHWLGGVGVLAFILALVKSSGAGFTLNLMRAEMPGPRVGKFLPRVQTNIRIIFATYLVLSAINLALLLAGGMPLFDALCTMFGTAGTGGFSIKNDGLASYSLYLQNVCTIFMLLFGINFALFYFLARGDWRTVVKDEELRLYLGTILAAVLVISVTLYASGFGSVGESFHHSAFAVSSTVSTTAFDNADINSFPNFARALLLFLMVFGSMSGSTGGGFKTMRLLILWRNFRAEMYLLSHPRSVKAIKINGKNMDGQIVKNTLLFLSVYCSILMVSFLLLSLDNHPVETSLFTVLSCLNNTGVVLRSEGARGIFADFSVFSKAVLCANMLLGRLEIFPLIVLFLPSTWKRKI